MTVMRHCSVLEPLLSYYHLSSYMQSLQRGGIRVSEKKGIENYLRIKIKSLLLSGEEKLEVKIRKFPIILKVFRMFKNYL